MLMGGKLDKGFKLNSVIDVKVEQFGDSYFASWQGATGVGPTESEAVAHLRRAIADRFLILKDNLENLNDKEQAEVEVMQEKITKCGL